MTDLNPNQPPGPLEDLARRVGNIGGKAEAEVQRIIAYLNDEVVPGVRKHSFKAMRSAGEQLTRLADELEKGPKAPKP